MPPYTNDRRALFCSADTHRKVKILAAMNNVSMVEYLESLILIAYESAIAEKE